MSDLEIQSNDYARIGAALDFLGENWARRPSYADAAKMAGLSPHHFHRMFSRWAGVSPKKFVDALAHDAARAAMEDGASVMEAAFEAGLSSPSRLHDQFLSFEAVTPGEAKSKGAGLNFVWGATDSPFGRMIVLESPRGLSAIAFAEPGGEESAFEERAARFPKANFQQDDRVAQNYADNIFVTPKPIRLALFGTPFQRQVWQALLDIPPGHISTYSDVATAIGRPKASRAVGAAVGANLLAWLIPCHRVLGRDARLTGYHWGLTRKRAMLTYEDIRNAS